MPRSVTSKHWLVVFLLCVSSFGQTRPEAPVPPSITATFTAATGGGFVGADAAVLPQSRIPAIRLNSPRRHQTG